jgi:hypothetical protein
VKITNSLQELYRLPELDEAIRAAVAGGGPHLEVLVSHAADSWHAEIVVMERGRRRLTYCADLNRTLEELSDGLRYALATSVVEPGPLTW